MEVLLVLMPLENSFDLLKERKDVVTFLKPIPILSMLFQN
jgi:hypothetical protein